MPRADVPPPADDAHERRGRLLLELAARVTSTLDLQQVLDASLAAMRELVDFGGGAIQLVDDGALVAAATDPPMSPEARTVRIPVGQGVSGTIAATGVPTYIPDLTVDERVFPQGRKRGISTGVRSYFGAPLIVHGGPIGVLQIDAPEVDAFGSDVRALVLAFVPTIAAAVQNARLFEQEREATMQLREAERQKRDFLSIVSHELRTPLTTLLGFATTLGTHRDRLTDEAAADLADRMVGAGHRLERLIDDLLDASRLDRGLLELDLVATPLAPLLTAVVTEWQPGPHTVALHAPEALPVVRTDPDRLQQVLGNLIGNAVKFSSPGEPIVVAAEVRGDRVAVSVRDRGPGIPTEIQQEVFGLFVQGGPVETRSTGGLGIGLYVVKRLCDAMDARIGVTSEAGQGATVTVELPRADVDVRRPAT
ncbi:ATP-binding protein [Nitriliruptor alkaliphilus]|uniref:GAF domain-containing sensor histidine kinase n=1 Tax=Nitriliruptor alkaliphilus TaxID=427918 RepID=UPI0006967FDC|nr:ATP-binding protein [Nitriliruptor alkaliphilus]